MYEYTDKVMKNLTVRMVRRFNQLKAKAALEFDELNDLRSDVDECYKECLREIRQAYLDIARHYYKEADGEDSVIDLMWIKHFLGGFDPVTKYIFDTEADRKRARAFEAIAVSKDAKEVDKALRLFHNQVKQWADEVTDEAVMEAYMSRGIKKVRWKTEEDSRVCSICGERNNEIYPVNAVPEKPHIGCRCYLLPIKP